MIRDTLAPRKDTLKYIGVMEQNVSNNSQKTQKYGMKKGGRIQRGEITTKQAKCK